MVVYFHTFSKRHNSTKVPEDQGVERECLLKEGTLMLSPVLEIVGLPSPPSANYCHIPDFGRYYFMDQWQYNKGIWSCQCEVDVLASWKPQILDTNAHVIFSSSDYNLMAVDNRIQATGNYIQTHKEIPFTGALAGQAAEADGYFCVVALAKETLNPTGVATHYFFTPVGMARFCNQLLDPGIWEQLKQFFDNPMDAIIECYYIPMDVTQYTPMQTTNMYLGEYLVPGVQPLIPSTDRSGALAVKGVSYLADVEWYYGDFRRTSGYTAISVWVPFCGTCNIPVDAICGYVPSPTDPTEYINQQLVINYGVDIITGDIAVFFNTQEHRLVLGELSGNCKISLPIGRSQTGVEKLIGALPGITMGVTGSATKNVALGISGVLSAAEGVKAHSGAVTVGGFSGSVLGATLPSYVNSPYNTNIIITITSQITTASPANIRPVIGNMCNRVRQINGLSGYCQTSEFSVSIDGMDTERDKINSLMDGGVYIE